MKTRTLRRPERGSRRALWRLWAPGAIAMSALLLAANALALPSVTTLGGSSAGYVDGPTHDTALFNTPIGVALDSANNFLYVADRDNNAIRLLNLSADQTFTFETSGIRKPVGVALDPGGNVYVLNRGNGSNGTILVFDMFGDVSMIATNLVNANGMALDALTNIYVTVRSNAVDQYSPLGGPPTTIATINTGISPLATNTMLQGITVTGNGLLAVADSGNNGIWLINPLSHAVAALSGFNGPGDHFGPKSVAQFNQPQGIAAAGGGALIVADNANNRVKVVDSLGTVTNLYGVNSSFWVSGDPFAGWGDGQVCPAGAPNYNCTGYAESRLPAGLTVAPNGDVYSTEDYFHIIRVTTGAGLSGVGPPPVPPLFNDPQGIALDGSGKNLYIADMNNNAVQLLNTVNNQTTTFLTAANGVNRPVDVALDSGGNVYVLNQGTGANGQILEFDPFQNLLATVATNLSLPSAMILDTSGNIFVAERGGAVKEISGASVSVVVTVTNAGVQLQGIALFDDGTLAVSDAGNHVIWQIDLFNNVSLLTGQIGLSGTNLGSSVFAKLNQPHHLAPAGGNLLVTADSGNNRVVVVNRAGSITNVLNSTNALVWFGRAGDPYGPSSARFVPMVSPVGVALGTGGGVFDSEIVYNDIREILGTGLTLPGTSGSAPPGVTNPVVPPPTISPSSGYYPMGQKVTVSVASGITNVHYTIDGGEPTIGSPSVLIGARNSGVIQWFDTTNDLTGLKVKAFLGTNTSATVTGQFVSTNNIGVPPGPSADGTIYGGVGSTIVVPVVCNLQSNVQVKSIQFRVEITPNGGAVPIAYGPGQFDGLDILTNDFIQVVTAVQGQGSVTGKVSIAYYTNGATTGLEISAIGNGNNISFQRLAVVSMLKIPIPYSASPGDSYSISVLFPSATSDGVNANVPLTPMPAATVLVTNIAYTVGDTASSIGAWYNAGLFGDGDLENADVNNVFYAAAGQRVPYTFTDAFNAMDAYPSDELGFTGGDGQIRFLDWNLILARSLRLDSNNWARVRLSDGTLASFTTNLIAKDLNRQAPKPNTPATWPWYRQALVGAISVGNAVANNTVSVPVYVKLGDGSTLAGLQFRAVVTPQNGAPALTAAPQLTLASGMPGTFVQQSFKASEKAFGWSLLPSTGSALNFLAHSSNLVGWLSFTIPASAQTGQRYAISFANADGAPNLTTQYDLETRSANVAVGASAAPASICSDEWKIHFFGSTTSPNAADSADPDGDGVPNWMEYLAGTDPTDANSKLRFTSVQKQVVSGQPQIVTHWLTAPGKAYEVQWSSSVKGGVWNTLTTVSGDGTVTTCTDTGAAGAARYYRLHVLP